MKICSKCKRKLEEGCFVKSARYSDGLYPSCKECRKATLLRYLEKNELCCRCNKEPHMKGNAYCRTCLRIVNNLPIERERPNVDRSNKTMCCRCKIKPRRKGTHYCSECGNAMNREWWRKNGSDYRSKPGNRTKINARQFVHWKRKQGQIEKHPCQVCGNPNSQAHHHKGYDADHRLDVVWLCSAHHAQVKSTSSKIV